MKKTFLPLILLFSVLLFSCSNDDDNNQFNLDEDYGFTGYYKIDNIHSSVLIDMNNDGIESTDILAEISSPHVRGEGKESVVFYNSRAHWAEVRPASDPTFKVRLIDLNYPYQIIAEETVEKAFLTSYLGRFRDYTYTLGANNKIDIKDDIVPEYNANFGTVNWAERSTDRSFVVNISTKLFNFKVNKWVDAQIEVTYIKVREY